MAAVWLSRASGFLEARGGDAAAVVIALVIGGTAAAATDVGTSVWADGNDIVGLAASVAVWWRRRATVAVAAFTFVAAAIAPLASGAAVVSVFALAAFRPGRPPAALVVLYVASAGFGAMLFPDQTMGTARSLLLGAVVTAGAVGWGLVVRSRGALFEASLEQARSAERGRIAAEMHDVLGHRLSLLSLHAGAIEIRPDAPADQLACSAAVVRASAHEAIEELRTVIDVLHDDEASRLTPPPTFAQIEALVDECRRAGMTITARIDVTAQHEMPPIVGRHAHRLVREGLTNARTHAPGAPVDLSLSGGPGEGLRVVLFNPLRPGGHGRGSGLGLVSLRERVERAGGSIQHGLDGRGAHRLAAWLPWPA